MSSNNWLCAIIQKKKKKNEIKIIDLLGRDTREIKNQLLFYIYNDGTVNKKIIIE